MPTRGLHTKQALKLLQITLSNNWKMEDKLQRFAGATHLILKMPKLFRKGNPVLKGRLNNGKKCYFSFPT